mmetsp:Transcript_3134/g.7184  ORF Transcript_3134/g.7184 Transcript_3134/m.7184 type:complete len:280 (-) Transcript_3134:202-1041(-)
MNRSKQTFLQYYVVPQHLSAYACAPPELCISTLFSAPVIFTLPHQPHSLASIVDALAAKFHQAQVVDTCEWVAFLLRGDGAWDRSLSARVETTLFFCPFQPLLQLGIVRIGVTSEGTILGGVFMSYPHIRAIRQRQQLIKGLHHLGWGTSIEIPASRNKHRVASKDMVVINIVANVARRMAGCEQDLHLCRSNRKTIPVLDLVRHGGYIIPSTAVYPVDGRKSICQLDVASGMIPVIVSRQNGGDGRIVFGGCFLNGINVYRINCRCFTALIVNNQIHI